MLALNITKFGKRSFCLTVISNRISISGTALYSVFKDILSRKSHRDFSFQAKTYFCNPHLVAKLQPGDENYQNIESTYKNFFIIVLYQIHFFDLYKCAPILIAFDA